MQNFTTLSMTTLKMLQKSAYDSGCDVFQVKLGEYQ